MNIDKIMDKLGRFLMNIYSITGFVFSFLGSYIFLGLKSQIFGGILLFFVAVLSWFGRIYIILLVIYIFHGIISGKPVFFKTSISKKQSGIDSGGQQIANTSISEKERTIAVLIMIGGMLLFGVMYVLFVK